MVPGGLKLVVIDTNLHRKKTAKMCRVIISHQTTCRRLVLQRTHSHLHFRIPSDFGIGFPGITVNMGKTMLLARLCLYMGLVLNIPIVTSQTTVQGNVGDRVLIPCPVIGSYNLPQWIKAGAILTSQDVTGANPAYPRISIDTDRKTLVVTSAQLNDSGTYECTHTSGTNSPQNVIVVIIEESEETNKKNGKEIETANCVFFPPDIVVVTVVIIICCHILINAYKEDKHNENKMEDKHNENKMKDKHNENKMKDKHNENKMEDKHNENKMEDKHNENKKKKKIKVVVILTIVEVLLFITVSIWFIVIQATVEDFEKLTTTEHIVTIILLVVEIVVFVQGVIAIFVFWKNRDYPTCDQCGGVMILLSSGGERPTAAIKPTAEINPGPPKQRSVMKPDVKPKSGDTGQHHFDVSPQHRPQPAPPPKERHGSDLSSVSRKDVKLDTIPPIRKNNSTTEFHMDNPESERSNMKVSSRGLSAVFDQEFDQPPTKRLPPLDHTARDEPVRRKKKKKKTRTNNDNVKFDNDYD